MTTKEIRSAARFGHVVFYGTQPMEILEEPTPRGTTVRVKYVWQGSERTGTFDVRELSIEPRG